MGEENHIPFPPRQFGKSKKNSRPSSPIWELDCNGLFSTVVEFFCSGTDIVARLAAPDLSDYDVTNLLSTPASALA